MNVHGIVLVEGEYNPGEFVSVAGMDISRLASASVGYTDGKFENVLGYVTDAKRVMGPQDCIYPSDWALLDVAHGKPYVRATAKLTNTGMTPFILKAGVKSFVWAATGHILEKQDGHIVRGVLSRIIMAPLLSNKDGGEYRIFPGVG